MAIVRLDRACQEYEDALTTIEGVSTRPSLEQVLKLLISRDQVYQKLLDDIPDKATQLIRVLDLDERLRKLAPIISKAVNLKSLRHSRIPETEAWWWSLETIPPRSRFLCLDWFWQIIVILLLTIVASLLLDISPRFFSGGPDARGAFAIIIQGVLAAAVAGGALTQSGNKAVERFLNSLHIPVWAQPMSKIILAASLVAILLTFRLILVPQAAVYYNDLGVGHFEDGRFTSARYSYERAIKLRPDYAKAHYNLGSLWDELGDTEAAESEYRMAAQGGMDAAYNNLARLYILESNYSVAVPLLLNGLDMAKSNEVKYALLKNLGWVRLEQKRFSEAATIIQEAITLNQEAAPAHCLFAQVLDCQQKSKEALLQWEACLGAASEREQDEDAWIALARQRLAGEPGCK